MYRQTIAAITTCAAILWALPGAAQTAAPAAPPPVDFSKVTIAKTDLGKGTYMLEGQGGNITVAVGGDGIIMVDGQFAPLHDKIRAAIAAITPLPIKYVVNTHYHGDHTGGNAGFAADGATITAHSNVKNRLAAGMVNGLTGVRTPPAAAAALPTKTYEKAITLRVKNRQAALRHINNAHTDGDTYVYFADANVLATGDIVTVGRYPNIDVANGGNIKGMIAAVTAYLKLSNKDTKIVPGHGPLLTRAQVADYRTMLVTARDRVAKLVAAGKTEDEAVAANPLADIGAQLRASDAASANFVRLIHRSLKA